MVPTRVAGVVVASVIVLVGLGGLVGLGVPGASGAGSQSAPGPNGTDIQFREVSNATGFTYNTTEPSGVISDAGVYASDYDRDGWTDLLAVGAQRPVLFENDRGELRRSGQLADVNISVRGAIFFDYDADGDDDLFLFQREGQPIVMTNDDGELHRTPGVLNVTFQRPVGATANDYDGDGCPDLFVVQNGDWSDRRPEAHETPDVSPDDDNGTPNRLFDGACGSFEGVDEEAGIRGTTWSLAASMVDLDGDGRPDIHVANDFNNDVVYWNDGDGTFTREILSAETNRNAMASEVEDFSGNGRLDLFVTNIYLPPDVDGGVAFVAGGRANGNNLLVNRGDRQFEPAGERCGVDQGGWGWAAVGTDLDNDGDTDLFHTTLEFTGRLGRDLLAARETGADYSYPVLFESRSSEGCQFASANASAAGFEVTDGHGAAQLDFDRDGDADIAMAVSAGPSGEARYRLYENVGATGGAVQVRVAGERPAGDARVTVTTGNETQLRVHHSRSDYFSQDERVLHFGVADHDTVDVRVAWPDGTELTVEDAAADERLVVSRDGVIRTVPLDGPPSESGISAFSTVQWVALVAIALAGAAVVGYRRRWLD